MAASSYHAGDSTHGPTASPAASTWPQSVDVAERSEPARPIPRRPCVPCVGGSLPERYLPGSPQTVSHCRPCVGSLLPDSYPLTQGILSHFGFRWLTCAAQLPGSQPPASRWRVGSGWGVEVASRQRATGTRPDGEYGTRSNRHEPPISSSALMPRPERFRITRPGVDGAERSEPTDLFRRAFIRLFWPESRVELGHHSCSAKRCSCS